MNEFALHPNVYRAGEAPGLVRMLEQVWIRDHNPGDGTFYLVSGFGNYNGGVRFFQSFREHVEARGNIVAVFAGSTAQRLTSKQLVTELLNAGVHVRVVNRKRLLHAKIYGSSVGDDERLIVTSGNFTGPGMSLNVEASVLLDAATSRAMGFSWAAAMDSLARQEWDIYTPDLRDPKAPVWNLLYDEYERELMLDESEEQTLLVTLSHADTARIQAASADEEAGRGTQYFWLSRDCYGFFPPLTVRNRRGVKATFSAIIRLQYVDIGGLVAESRVTFEAENNLDFRLGTAPLKFTRMAAEGDLAAITRLGETEYQLRLFRRGTPLYEALLPYTVTFIGHRGKRYGYISNAEFARIAGVRLPVAAAVRGAVARPEPAAEQEENENQLRVERDEP